VRRRYYHPGLLRTHRASTKFALARRTDHINPVPGAYCIIQHYICPSCSKVCPLR